MWPWLVEAAGKVLYGTIASRAGRCVWLRLVEAVWNVECAGMCDLAIFVSYGVELCWVLTTMQSTSL